MINDFLKLTEAGERVIVFILFVLLFTHVTGCLWFYSAKLDNFNPDTWIVKSGMTEAENHEIYMASFYYILTTVTTVGYGDISASTFTER